MKKKTRLTWKYIGFAGDTRGSTGLVFSLSIIPMILIGGAAMDLSRAVREKSQLQAATDSAALAVGRIMSNASTAEMTSVATGHLTAGQNAPIYTIVSGPTVNADKSEICITTRASMETAVMKLGGVNYVDLNAKSCAKTGGITYEVALALDNTGSMGRSKLAAMKTSAKSLIDQLLPPSASTFHSKISLVPFSSAVKAFDPEALAEKGNDDESTRFNQQSWIDTTGASSIHWENFPKLANGSFQPASRFELFKNINVSWSGCFETRPGDFALKDDPAAASGNDSGATASQKNSLYVPYFAPDEGDNARNKWNSYISDYGNSVCEQDDVYKTRDEKSPYFGDGQSKLCKYKPGVQVTVVPGACTTEQVCSQSSLPRPLKKSVHIPGLVNKAAYIQGPVSKMLNNLPTIASDNKIAKLTLIKRKKDDDDDDDDDNGGGNNWDGIPGLNTNCNKNPTAAQCVSFCQDHNRNAPWCSTGPTCRNVTTCEPDTTTTTPLTINASGPGPNKACETRPVTQLSTDRVALRQEVDRMQALGTTNLVSAVMWAWKTVSPNSPYANFGKIEPYTKANHQKIIVLMTDGDNTWSSGSTSNGSQYGPFGYAWNNRLGSAIDLSGKNIGTATENNTSSKRSKFMDAKTLEACTNAKAAGVKIFTVGFSSGGSGISSSGKALLQACASTPSTYFLATNSQQLLAAFTNIGNSLQGLHISR